MADLDGELETGYVCDCGQFHEFIPYVYAHWTIDLDHFCTECGRTNRVREGAAECIKEPDPSLTKEMD